MEHQANRQANRILAILLVIMLGSCNDNNLADVNMSIPDNSWLYAKSVKTTVEIEDANANYSLSFKIRNTADYRYSNIFVIMRLKGDSLTKSTRYQFQLAKADGQWLGKGSGDLYSNSFPLLKKLRFPKIGKYEIEIEQNMRENPLLGISDIGLTLTKND
ncbi:MAG: gliding motility lipoprotein GldH [Pedobacter sp.]|nr:MAG: gliding motility lipoprotein GldH [Pedobacter sp.]